MMFIPHLKKKSSTKNSNPMGAQTAREAIYCGHNWQKRWTISKAKIRSTDEIMYGCNVVHALFSKNGGANSISREMKLIALTAWIAWALVFRFTLFITDKVPDLKLGQTVVLSQIINGSVFDLFKGFRDGIISDNTVVSNKHDIFHRWVGSRTLFPPTDSWIDVLSINVNTKNSKKVLCSW